MALEATVTPFPWAGGDGWIQGGTQRSTCPAFGRQKGGGHRDMREKISKNATIKCDFSKFSSQREVKTPSPGSLRTVH